MKSPSLSAFLSTVHGQVRRALVWLPWLVVALLVAAALSPGTVVASRLVFQSPESPPPPPTETEVPVPTDTPVPAPTNTPVPAPTDTPVPAAAPTDTPVPAAPATQAPAPTKKAAPTPVAPPAKETPPAQASPTPAVTAPASPIQTPPAQGTPPAKASPSPAAKATAPPVPSPTPRSTRTPTPEPQGEATVNWVKFWDTLMVWLAYPWMCCGVGLLLLVPLFLLYLEISGRRRPPLPPEIPPEPAGEEFTPDEEYNE